MFTNYLKIAWRNLLKNKLFSFINVIGLGLAMPFALISLLTVQVAYETDNFHPFPQRTYRIITYATPAHGSQVKYATTPYILSDKIVKDYPFVEKATRTVRLPGWELTNQIKTIRVNPLMVEPQFFSMFGFELSEGNIPIQPNTMVVTSDMAKRFFGDIDPVGKVLTHSVYGDLLITGVLKRFKSNTHFGSDVMVSMASLKKSLRDSVIANQWKDYQEAYTYVLLREQSNRDALNKAIYSISKEVNAKVSPDHEILDFHLQALGDISPDFLSLINNPYVMSWTGDLAVIFLMAILLLLLAGFNYTNLTLAKSLHRAKEVGVRKVAGASRSQIISQFLVETILISIISLIIGFVVLGFIKEYVHVQWINWEVDHPLILWSCFLIFTIVLGIVAGIVPSFYLSRFQPIGVLKSNISPMSYGKISIRNGLMVTQFAVSLIFLLTIGYMYNQFNYMATDNVNFNRKDILNISLKGKASQNLINDLLKDPRVQSIGLTSSLFGYTARKCDFKKDALSTNLSAFYYAANRQFIENMHLTLLAGTNLEETTSDRSSDQILINEQTVYALGYQSPAEAIGKAVSLHDNEQVIIQGVVKNFCYGDYRSSNHPIILQYNPALFNVISILLKTSLSKPSIIESLSAIWKRHQPYQDFSYSWYADELSELYSPGSELKFQSCISGIILLIAILGLLGIVIYTVEKRLKEMSIRKVLGADIQNIIYSLSWRFIKLLLIAIIIAVPIGVLIGNKFISLYTFKAEINSKLNLAIIGGIFCITLSIIILNAIKAAIVNPIKSLRSE